MTATTPHTTPRNYVEDAETALRTVRSRRLHGIRNRFAASCRVRGFGY